MIRISTQHDNATGADKAIGEGDILPDLTPDEYEALKESIAGHGVEIPVVVDQSGDIIDGKSRRRACDELGIECPSIVRHVESETERLQLRLKLNCNRRHLNREQKRAMIAAYLKADPQIGNQELGEIVGASKNTVESVRAEAERTGQIDHLDVLRGKDNKFRRRRRTLANTEKKAEKAADIQPKARKKPEALPLTEPPEPSAEHGLTVHRDEDREEDGETEKEYWASSGFEPIELYEADDYFRWSSDPVRAVGALQYVISHPGWQEEFERLNQA